ncbi:cell division protein ZapA [Prevotella amnii]|jgi:hypothetical protein|uniref:Cell division protein ZapA n=3 Tax=Prevotella amnii TaxID=419005 RepID=A0A096CAS2_9BACT|nr:cell division protein ZapA [Prevotella amnii]EFN90356.1 hypothetical protein HMPREF9018_1905 [Prevotella amnii CRIS 21A-A]KGF52037.1 cell division protein ZapA [Prevotella amnii DNF00058]KXB77804.1 hypothetical protein HMPREF1860_01258 [Prevotella amnii]
MDDNNKLHIRLHIYDTELPVGCPRDDEEYYRSAAKLLNDMMNTYFTRFKGKKTDKEILYMVMFDVALQLKQNEDRNDTAPYDKLLSKLTTELEETLE